MSLFDTSFLTFTNSPDDPNYMGEAEEMAALHLRTEALEHSLRTGRDFDVLLDMLAEHGQDPIAYVDEVCDEVELIVCSHLPPAKLVDWHGIG